MLLAEDETDLLLFPPLRAGWALRGQPAPVPLRGANAKRVVFGAVNVETGRRLFLARPRQRAADCRAFWEYVHWHHRGWHVALLLDEHPSHTARATQRLAGWLGFELLWLPKRSPHLNPMDHLWRHGKEAICANHQYATIDEQVDRFLGYLSGLSAHEALRKAGLLSEASWLNL